MLAPIEVDSATEALHARERALASRLIDTLATRAQRFACRAGEPLRERDGWLFIDEGFVKLMVRDRTVRYYGVGDMLPLDHGRDGAQLESEFRLRGRLLSKAALDSAMSNDAQVRATVIEWLSTGAKLLASLCAEHAAVDRPPPTRLVQVAAGDIILREDEHCDEVFVLIEGSARVTRHGVHVGDIIPCEFAGEISLLTGEACGATVTAATPCLLQAIHKASLAETVRHRPETVLELARTLAQRLSRANDQQAEMLRQRSDPGAAGDGHDAPRPGHRNGG